MGLELTARDQESHTLLTEPARCHQTYFKIITSLGHLGGSVVEHLPLAQGVIPGSGMEAYVGLPAWSLLLPLPVSLPLSVCVSHE